MTDEGTDDGIEPIAADRVRLVVAEALAALGVPAPDAAAVAEVLVEADLTGVDSHGIHLLLMYADRLRSGQIRPVTEIEVLDDSGSTVWLDAGLGMGQVAGLRAVDLVVERARAHGVATVSVREATHLGALGVYTRRVAEQGLVCLCVQNGPTVVPPYGGVTPMFSTNPFSYAIPTDRHPTVVYDIATTAVAGNRLLLAKRRGDATIPEGWANDEQGRPTTDTEAASVWNLQWFGGHKGYGLGLPRRGPGRRAGRQLVRPHRAHRAPTCTAGAGWPRGSPSWASTPSASSASTSCAGAPTS